MKSEQRKVKNEKLATALDSLLERSNFSFFTFHFSLKRWYAEYKRTLPWRDVRDPYHVWVSEIILQQTQVAQGYDYYLRFIRRFPDVETLAQASSDDVMNQWQGLGYYSRARNLHAAAKRIVAAAQSGEQHLAADKGEATRRRDRVTFPQTYAEVRALPGVGDYTAAAICSFAYNQPYATVDGNVYRVLSRLFAIDTPIDTARGKREFAQLAAKLLDTEHPAEHNQALMDFGALQCTPAAPHCDSLMGGGLQAAETCPFARVCQAYLLGSPTLFPVKSKRTAVRSRYFLYLLFVENGTTLLRRRPAGDIWQGLYEPPLIELPAPLSPDKAIALIREQTGLNREDSAHASAVGQEIDIHPIRLNTKHQLTHQTLYADLYFVAALPTTRFTDYFRVPLSSIDDYPLPRLVEQLLAAAQAI